MTQHKGPKSIRARFAFWSTALIALLAIAACGSSSDPTPTSTVRPAATTDLTVAPAAPPTTTPTPAPRRAESEPSPTRTPTPAPTATPAPVFDEQRPIGRVEGVAFLVVEGSEATFTVGEELSILPLPSDAVVRTTALSGQVYLDGRASVVQIDLQKLSSDSSLRDGYVRNRMFGRDPIATFTLDGLGPLPEGFTEGEVVETQVSGILSIRGVDAPLTFEIEARDDGDVLFILGRTTFTWDDFGLTRPVAGPVISVEDEVRVEVLISARPLAASGS